MSVDTPKKMSRVVEGHEIVYDSITADRMRRVRREGTKPELAVRSTLHRLGVRFRVHNRDLPGSPDVANRSKRWAIFVHGCFWHRHPGCRQTTSPKRNREFWQAKFDRNVERDRRAADDLEQMGYTVLTIWECETSEPTKLERQLLDFLPQHGADAHG